MTGAAARPAVLCLDRIAGEEHTRLLDRIMLCARRAGRPGADVVMETDTCN
jgi:hypothetical protein